MILYGTSITTPNDPLRKLTVAQLHAAIRSPKPESVSLIRQLRIVRQIDAKQYATLKRHLPYFVCGSFTPPVRRSENFASTNRMVIDLDHLADKQVDPTTLRQRLVADPRVEMLFMSPSGDGLKVLIRLKEPCRDSGLFSIFYKSFLHSFAAHYEIDQVVDTRTSDVTRACFFSFDPDAYYNPEPQPVDMNAFVDMGNTLTIFNAVTAEAPAPVVKERSVPVGDPVVENIKQVLHMANTRRTKAKAEAYVPEQLNDIMDELQAYIEQTGTIVRNVANIQYGKKIQLSIAGRLSETNLFYGKRGFSVVISPRTGTDAEANRLAAELIQAFIDTEIIF